MKLYKEHANTGKWIEKIKTRKDINTCNMTYHYVTVPFHNSEYLILTLISMNI